MWPARVIIRIVRDVRVINVRESRRPAPSGVDLSWPRVRGLADARARADVSTDGVARAAQLVCSNEGLARAAPLAQPRRPAAPPTAVSCRRAGPRHPRPSGPQAREPTPLMGVRRPLGRAPRGSWGRTPQPCCAALRPDNACGHSPSWQRPGREPASPKLEASWVVPSDDSTTSGVMRTL